jgi:hypothetical protein
MRLLQTLAYLATASAAVLPRAAEVEPRQDAVVDEGYVFAYFKDNSLEGEKIFLAASKGNNALDWEELNGGQPVLTSTKGTKGLRDPFLIRVRLLTGRLHGQLLIISTVARWKHFLPRRHRPEHRFGYILGRFCPRWQPIP